MEATDDFRGPARNVDELGQYRSLSTLAVAAFLLGLGFGVGVCIADADRHTAGCDCRGRFGWGQDSGVGMAR